MPNHRLSTYKAVRNAMKRYITVFIILLIPGLLISQDIQTGKGVDKVNTNIPVQAQYSNQFTIKNLFFNKKIDPTGMGEILEIEFLLENLTDDPQDLYIFTIATFEKIEATRSSFERPITLKERVRTFVTYPDDLLNFSYPDLDQQGNQKKDKNGADLIKLLKFPKNPKAGVDALTGKPYRLFDKKHIRTTHLSRYRKNYFFFNNLAVLVFDSEGKPAYRQLYMVKGKRNR